MKKQLFLIVTLLVVTATCFAQAKNEKPAPAKDSLTQSTPLLNIQDVNDFISLMAKKFSVDKLADFQELTQFLDTRVKQRIGEFTSKQKK